METPPPYIPSKPKSKTGLVVGLVIAAVLVCCVAPIALLGGGAAWFMSKGQDFMTCTLSYTLVPKAVTAYIKKNNGTLPKAATWQDDVRPYYKKIHTKLTKKEDMGPFKLMPAEGDWGCSEAGETSCMAFNTELAGKKLADIKDPGNTIMLFETSKTGKNLAFKFKEEPFEKSPKMMGTSEHRGWFVVMANGELYVFGRDGKRARASSSASMDINVDDL